MQTVLIPLERVKKLMALAVKKEIEKQGNITLSSEEEGEIQIASKDPLAEWKAQDIIKAIGRGFEPDTAMKLFNEEYIFKLINLKEIFSNEKQRTRYKSRIIGTKGKVKKAIEEITDASICVYGSTVGIIGKMDEVGLAQKAIDMIINGASHGSVFNMLRKARQKMKEIELY